ncbi:MAG: HPr(Ser) kinase/phosphatase [Betaproteobacteria bacterium]|nr:HPr(Ser) kinase/phosphatase [Betaproteobacteria bacterium]
MQEVGIVQLYEDHCDKLGLVWELAVGVKRRISLRESGIYGADVIGHMNLIHPERLQVIGAAEIAWIDRISEAQFARQLGELAAAQPPALIVAEGLPIPERLRKICEITHTPLFTSTKPCAAVVEVLRIYLSGQLAETTSIHGVFMDVLGMGVLITGDSGIGKSELALELISRGHGLIADDVVELARIAPNTLEGRCPGMLQDYLEVRGLGLLNIRSIFGETAARRKMSLQLIVYLQRPAANAETPRLPLDSQTQKILNVPIRKVVISVMAGRNLAVLIETAVRNTILQMRGIDSMQEFISRQQQALVLDDML